MSEARFINWGYVMRSRTRRSHCASAEGLYSAPAWDADARQFGLSGVDLRDAEIVDYCVRAALIIDREILVRHYIYRSHPLRIQRILGLEMSRRQFCDSIVRARSNALAFERFAMPSLANSVSNKIFANVSLHNQQG